MRITAGVSIDTPIRKKAYQLQAICSHPDMTVDTVFNSAVSIIGEWLQVKTNYIPNIRDEMKNVFRTCSSENDNIIINIVYDEFTKQWACKYIQPDSEIPARMWTTQVSIYKEKNDIRIDVLNVCTSPKSCDSPVPMTTPGFIESLHKQIGLFAKVEIRPMPLYVGKDLSIDDLYQLISDGERTMPIIVVSAMREYGRDKYLIDRNLLAEKCFSVAFVVDINYQATFDWTAKVGRLWSVFDGAIRVYYPNVDFQDGDMYQHPLITKQRIIERTGCEESIDWITSTTKMKRLQYSSGTQGLKMFSDMQQLAIERQRVTSQAQQQDNKDTILLLQMEVDNLNEKIKEQTEINRSLEETLLDISIENEHRDKENYTLVTQIDHLRNCLEEKGKSCQDEITFPNDINLLEQWCEDFLSGRIFLSSKAKRAAKKSYYSDASLIFKALFVLAHEYRDMRLGHRSQAEYEKALEEIGLKDEGKPISESRAGEQGDTYYFDFNGEKKFMEKHLRKSKSFNPTENLAIYFSWDQQSGKVLIGSLPAHLDTRISN